MKQMLLLSLLSCLTTLHTDAYSYLNYRKQPTHTKVHRSAVWATHVTIDLHDCTYSKVRSQHEIERFIKKLCSHLGVTRYDDAEFLYHYSGQGYTSGYTATQQANGHTDIAIRVNEENNNVHIDLFSCVPFDPYIIAHKARKFFFAYDMHYYVSYRK